MSRRVILPFYGGFGILLLHRSKNIKAIPARRFSLMINNDNSPKPLKNSDHTRNQGKDRQQFRLNRCIIGFSRREADRLVEQGRVLVNDQRANLGQMIKPGDIIILNNRQIDWEPYFQNQFTSGVIDSPTKSEENMRSPHVYLKLWKEKNVICTTTSNDGMNNLMQIYNFQKYFPKTRLFPVGRLDKDSTGLLLLTSDPSFQTALLHDKQLKGTNDPASMEKIYEVTFDRKVEASVLRDWRKGFPMEVPIVHDSDVSKVVTITTKPCSVIPLREDSYEADRNENRGMRSKGAKYEIILKEGKNRQIRRMAEIFGYRIYAIHRIGFCGVTLKGLPRPGTWKELSLSEIEMLQKSFLTGKISKIM